MEELKEKIIKFIRELVGGNRMIITEMIDGRSFRYVWGGVS